jgi:hypothetical protein
MNQYKREKVDIILNELLDNLSTLIHYYIPLELIEEKKCQVYGSLIDYIAQDDLDEDLMIPIVDNLFNFLYKREHIDLALTWLEVGYIYLDEEKTELFELADNH